MFNEKKKIKNAFNKYCGDNSSWELSDNGEHSYISISDKVKNRFANQSNNYFNKYGDCITFRCVYMQQLSVGKGDNIYVDLSDFEADFKEVFGVTEEDKMLLPEYVDKVNSLIETILDISEHIEIRPNQSMYLYINEDMLKGETWPIGITFYPDYTFLDEYSNLHPNSDYAEYLERVFAIKKADSKCNTDYADRLECVEPYTFSKYKESIMAYLEEIEQRFISKATSKNNVTFRVDERVKKLLEARGEAIDVDTETA